MAHPQIAVFARLAKENAKPSRVIAGQKTFLARTMHDIRYDPVHDEIFVTNPFAQAILVFRGDASGEEAPIRVISGPNAKLNNVDRLDVDVVHNEIVVPNRDSVLVFPRDGNGNIAPIREIRGPDTKVRGAAIAVDPVNNVIVIGSDDGLVIFNRTDNGNVAPRRVIGGPNTGIDHIGQIGIYPPKGWVAVTMDGQFAEMGVGPWGGGGLIPTTAPDTVFVGGWSIHDNGNVPPRWKLTQKNGLMRPRGVVFIPQHKEIAVADMRMNAVLTFHWPEIF